jgi:hypothetical protein
MTVDSSRGGSSRLPLKVRSTGSKPRSKRCCGSPCSLGEVMKTIEQIRAGLAVLAPQVLAVISARDSWESWVECAGLDLPWGQVPGSHGRVFVTRQRMPSNAHLTTVWLDGRAVWHDRSVYRYYDYPTRRHWIDPVESEEWYQAARAANKAAQAAYDAAVEEALAAAAWGQPLRYLEGQQGGVFVTPSGATVSAPGLSRRTGKTTEEISSGEPRIRIPASRKARNHWRNVECA